MRPTDRQMPLIGESPDHSSDAAAVVGDDRIRGRNRWNGVGSERPSRSANSEPLSAAVNSMAACWPLIGSSGHVSPSGSHRT